MTSHVNAERARLIIDELVRCGIDQFILAPGFRSAPLALAAVSHPASHVTVHFDERGNAFFALGHGRATLKPCVWITTSGTAAVNGFPAVVESAMDEVPMICLTADRPPELRDTGSNQTIDQVHLFGHYPKWFADLPPPSSQEDEEFIRSTIDYAVFQARNGPVHLNCMFREPLLEVDYKEKSIPEIPWPDRARPQTHYSTQMGANVNLEDELVKKIQGAERGMIVAGRLQTLDEGKAISQLALHLGWPVLPDVCATIEAPDLEVNFFDLIVRSKLFADRNFPDVMLHFGGPLVSKELQKYLVSAPSSTYALITPSYNRIDPFHAVTDRIQEAIPDFCRAIKNRLSVNHSGSTWRDVWLHADSIIQELLSSTLREDLSEPSIVWELSHLVDKSNWIFGASSMPIRDLQIFLSRREKINFSVFSNRGASGIDGTLATVSGIAQTRSEGGTVLLGDLAMLHDLNSLSLLKDKNVTIVVINNNGGGIFHMLPLALNREDFEKVLGTPHNMNFQCVAEQFQIPYSLAGSLEQFRKTWCLAASTPGPSLIEVQTNRKENAMLHKKLYDLAVERIEAIF